MPDTDYNVAPTSYQPIVRQNREGERELLLARIGPKSSRSRVD